MRRSRAPRATTTSTTLRDEYELSRGMASILHRISSPPKKRRSHRRRQRSGAVDSLVKRRTWPRLLLAVLVSFYTLWFLCLLTQSFRCTFCKEIFFGGSRPLQKDTKTRSRFLRIPLTTQRRTHKKRCADNVVETQNDDWYRCT